MVIFGLRYLYCIKDINPIVLYLVLTYYLRYKLKLLYDKYFTNNQFFSSYKCINYNTNVKYEYTNINAFTLKQKEYNYEFITQINILTVFFNSTDDPKVLNQKFFGYLNI